MWRAIGAFLEIILKLFGYGDKNANKRDAYRQAVINEAMKYEKGADNAANIRIEEKELDKELNSEYEKKFGKKE